MEKQKNSEKEHYIIYFDLLGYKQYFEENKEHQSLLLDIIKMLKEVKEITGVFGKFCKNRIKVRAFSDNFIICVETAGIEEIDVEILSYVIAYLQAGIFMDYGLLVRGGLTKGKFYMDDQIVYGEGLIRAVELEKEAKFPRIIIDTEILGSDPFYQRIIDYAAEDIDGKQYLDYHKRLILTSSEIFQLKNQIINKIKKDGKYNPSVKDESKIKVYESIIQKVVWLAEKFNEACDKMGKPEERIPYQITINKRLLRMEIVLNENE